MIQAFIDIYNIFSILLILTSDHTVIMKKTYNLILQGLNARLDRFALFGQFGGDFLRNADPGRKEAQDHRDHRDGEDVPQDPCEYFSDEDHEAA